MNITPLGKLNTFEKKNEIPPPPPLGKLNTLEKNEIPYPLGKLNTFEKNEIHSFNKRLNFLIIPKYNDNISPTLKIQIKKNTKLPNSR